MNENVHSAPDSSREQVEINRNERNTVNSQNMSPFGNVLAGQSCALGHREVRFVTPEVRFTRSVQTISRAGPRSLPPRLECSDFRICGLLHA